jgi:hypothetical protein
MDFYWKKASIVKTNREDDRLRIENITVSLESKAMNFIVADPFNYRVRVGLTDVHAAFAPRRGNSKRNGRWNIDANALLMPSGFFIASGDYQTSFNFCMASKVYAEDIRERSRQLETSNDLGNFSGPL